MLLSQPCAPPVTRAALPARDAPHPPQVAAEVVAASSFQHHLLATPVVTSLGPDACCLCYIDGGISLDHDIGTFREAVASGNAAAILDDIRTIAYCVLRALSHLHKHVSGGRLVTDRGLTGGAHAGGWAWWRAHQPCTRTHSCPSHSLTLLIHSPCSLTCSLTLPGLPTSVGLSTRPPPPPHPPHPQHTTHHRGLCIMT